MHMLVFPWLSSVSVVSLSSAFSCSAESVCHSVQEAAETPKKKVSSYGCRSAMNSSATMLRRASTTSFSHLQCRKNTFMVLCPTTITDFCCSSSSVTSVFE